MNDRLSLFTQACVNAKGRNYILRLINKTHPQSIMPTGSKHVVDPGNAPY